MPGMSVAEVLDLTDRRAGEEGLQAPDYGEPWWEHAACREGGDTGALFFSERLRDIARAKRMCATCPVMTPCLEGALVRREPWGVWGGQLFQNGRILALKRRRGRPSKVPRPEEQLPDVPIPAHLRRLAVVHVT
jgi:WhiB family transcriptional regulator, redox-sensing transcriptional regulator